MASVTVRVTLRCILILLLLVVNARADSPRFHALKSHHGNDEKTPEAETESVHVAPSNAPTEEIIGPCLQTLESAEDVNSPRRHALQSLFFINGSADGNDQKSPEAETESAHVATFKARAEEIIRPRLHTLESAEEVISPLPHDLQSLHFINGSDHVATSTEASTSSTSDCVLDIGQQPICRTIQDVREKQWEYLKNIVQFLGMSVPFVGIIILSNGWLRVVEAVIYLLAVSAAQTQLFSLAYHEILEERQLTATNAGNNDAATSSPYVFLLKLTACLASIFYLFAVLNAILYEK